MSPPALSVLARMPQGVVPQLQQVRETEATVATVSSHWSLPSLWPRGFGSASDCRRYRRATDGIDRTDRINDSPPELPVLSILSCGQPASALGRNPRQEARDTLRVPRVLAERSGRLYERAGSEGSAVLPIPALRSCGAVIVSQSRAECVCRVRSVRLSALRAGTRWRTRTGTAARTGPRTRACAPRRRAG
jgi:hypothetical protein